MADLCAPFSSFFPLSTYVPASSFCASYTCIDSTTTATATSTLTSILSTTTSPISIVTAFQTDISTVFTTTTDASFVTSAIFATTTVTATVTPFSPLPDSTTTTVTVTTTPLAKRDVCTTRPAECHTFLSTELVPRLVTHSCSQTISTKSSVAAVVTSTLSAYQSPSEKATSSADRYPQAVYESSAAVSTSCTTTGHSGVSTTPVKPASYLTPSQSLCSGKTRHSKNTRSTSSTKQYAGSSSASMNVYPTAASASRSSRAFSTSVDTLSALLSSLQTQPTSIISSACACIEASSACTTSTSTTTATITQAQTVIVTVAVLSTVTSTATSVTTSTERAVVTTTVISLAGTITDTVTQTLPSFTRSTVTVTSTVTETARPPRPTICASNKLFELYAGQRLNAGEGVRQTGGGTGYSPADCASRCAISVTCGGFNHLGPANACFYYSTSPANGGNQAPNDPALARSLGPETNYSAGIYVGPC